MDETTTLGGGVWRRCSICRHNRVHALERCMACYQYLRRYGVDRPWTLIVAAGERELVRRTAIYA